MSRSQATDEERQAVWEMLLLHSNGGMLRHGDIGRTAAYFDLNRCAVSRIWEQGIRSMGERKDRGELCKRLAEVAVNDRENQRAVQEGSGVSSYLVQQLIKEGFLRRALRQTRPLLTPSHRLRRLRFCMDHVIPQLDGTYKFDAMHDVVHIDEKWFYVEKIGQHVYVLTGKDGCPTEEPPVQDVQSKRYITKVMFLCAVARPRGGWDGKVGIWPVVETYITQRRSVNRPAGVEETRPVSITRDISRRILVNDVIPAIKAKWPQDQKRLPIKIQQDNARPHVLADDLEVAAAGCADGWAIKLVNQPAQSPDLNCLDLGFFASIQSLQSKTIPRTPDELIKEHVMEQILKNEGRNNYRLGHLHKEKLIRADELPVSLSCDGLTLALAQQAAAALSFSISTTPVDVPDTTSVTVVSEFDPFY
ncbi:hypothetical protein F443_13850 [Phytophthora nicotianae P1569]|uniref:DUF7769 domain-containing protein n=1 Tax=Phytophthora nicotianae P1569 TaxID=1317065 RepID=V9ERX1_PHYNI|nr:hypothetical protein F443_13850 [Phytophthora nicotianae P1569]